MKIKIEEKLTEAGFHWYRSFRGEAIVYGHKDVLMAAGEKAIHDVCDRAEAELDARDNTIVGAGRNDPVEDKNGKYVRLEDRNPEQAKALVDVAGLVKKYVDKTGTDEKPNPMRDVYQEFPLAIIEISKVTAFGATKHAPRGWQTFESAYGFAYHTSKVGRHLLAEETEGPVNESDGGLLHAAQVAWNALARLEFLMRGRNQAS